MKDIFNFFLVVSIFLLLLYACGRNKGTDPISIYIKGDSTMKAKIGKRMLYEKDSLTIVDYSFWDDTYTLSNGVKVNKKLLE